MKTNYTKTHAFEIDGTVEVGWNKSPYCVCGLPEDNPIHGCDCEQAGEPYEDCPKHGLKVSKSRGLKPINIKELFYKRIGEYDVTDVEAQGYSIQKVDDALDFVLSEILEELNKALENLQKAKEALKE
jgi:hypothetical protein